MSFAGLSKTSTSWCRSSQRAVEDGWLISYTRRELEQAGEFERCGVP